MERCLICNAVIGENNTIGIGGGCYQNVVIPAKKDCFKEIKGLDLWIAKVNLLKPIFVDLFKDTKFRSSFKKSFYVSMACEDLNDEPKRISKKQFDIMYEQIQWKDHYLLPDFSDLWLRMFKSFDPQFECRELYNERIEIHKIQYLSGRKNVQSEKDLNSENMDITISEII